MACHKRPLSQLSYMFIYVFFQTFIRSKNGIWGVQVYGSFHIQYNLCISIHLFLGYFCFMFNLDYYLLCSIIFFTEVSEVHQYNTRSATKQSYYLPKVRTNYGKFNIRFQAPGIWNAINEQVKIGSLSKLSLIKSKGTIFYFFIILMT